MRRRLIPAGLVAIALLAAACGGGRSASPPAPPGLAARTVEAGAVTVRIDPARVDAGGAELKISFDTHSVPLDLDVARNATLTVGGTAWTGAQWSGDGPGGHHRSGTLRFTAGGPARGPAVVRIAGLPAPVTATWSLGG